MRYFTPNAPPRSPWETPMQPTPAPVKDSLTPAPTLLDAIRAEQNAQLACALALLEQPETQARIHLAEDLAMVLDRAGFDTHHQQIFKNSAYDRKYGEPAVTLIVQTRIQQAHWMAGQARLAEILQRRGGRLAYDGLYTEGRLSITLSVMACTSGYGWAPAQADQAA